MSQIARYEQDPYRTSLTTRVVEAGEGKAGPFAVLEDTIFYPEGGGQPADRGWLGEIPVLDVRRHEGRIHHLLERPAAPGSVEARIDWARRFDHMQQHTAQHLLTAVTLARFGWWTTSFHLRETECDIELSTERIEDSQLAELEELVAAEIRAVRPIRTRRVEPQEYERLEVRSRGLPAGHSGSIRLVEIEGLDLNTCGGTHVRTTAELECLKLLGAEPCRGGMRLRWIAGGRVRHRLAEHEVRTAELRRVLDTGDDELVEIVRLKLAQLKEMGRRFDERTDRWATQVAEALAMGSGSVAEVHFEAVDLPFLQRVGRRFSELEGGPPLAFLTATEGEAHALVLAASADGPGDVVELGRRVSGVLGGRGGGRGKIFQGKVPSLGEREQALATVTD
jgi:Ser-tRNA(Ala) deacylase AlaX